MIIIPGIFLRSILNWSKNLQIKNDSLSGDTLCICILALALLYIDKHTLILNWGKILYEPPDTLR